jgi:hypothetical protein
MTRGSGKLNTHGTFLRHRVAATQESVHAGWCSLRKTRNGDDASFADSFRNAGCLVGHRNHWGVGERRNSEFDVLFWTTGKGTLNRQTAKEVVSQIAAYPPAAVAPRG